jgi:Xaa-Pro aminopeptidase
LNYLHYHRAYKTDYEAGNDARRSKLGARAHRAAESAFRDGASEYGIHMAYLAAVHETESELPYSNIIALNQHGAVLHYTDLNRAPPAHSNSFLIDAGASFHGYASDITRTYAATARRSSRYWSTRSTQRSADSSPRCAPDSRIRNCTCIRIVSSPASCVSRIHSNER